MNRIHNTPGKRKALYRVAAAVMLVLSVKGLVTKEEADVFLVLIAAVLEVAAQNVPSSDETK